MSVWVYSVGPIDFWFGWLKPHEFFRVVGDPMDAIDGPLDAREWFDIWDRARKLARELYWEGDIRPGSGPFVIPLPVNDPGDTAFCIGWKQDNNGQTFIASTIELPHLRDGDNWRKE